MKMKHSKKLSGLLLAVCMSFGCLSIGGTGQIQVHAITKQQADTKISSLKQQINTLKNQKKTAQAAEKKERAGATYLLAEVICTSPYILHDTLSGGYFWVNNSQYLNDMWVAATGYVKQTGNYRTYNGITCTECNSVKVTNKSVTIQNKINAKNKVLKKYQNALKDKVKLTGVKIKAGKKAKIDRTWKYTGAYNTLKWKSSDSSIAAVDSNGRVTGKKAGKVTITAKASLSGITSKCTVTVIEDQKEDQNSGWDQEPGDENTGSVMYFDAGGYIVKGWEFYPGDIAYITLYVSLEDGDDVGELSITSSNEEAVVVAEKLKISENEYQIGIKMVRYGDTVITATAENGLTAQCTLEYTEEPLL